MKKILFGLAAVVLLFACQRKLKNNQVKFITTAGNIIVELSDETPQHRDNFLKLAREGKYDSLLFHRVIENFMIQTGDPNSKEAQAGEELGRGELGYTTPEEIQYPKLYHKKGALAAARKGDNVNVKKASSGTQFYIVQGEIYTDKELDQVEKQMNKMMVDGIFYQIREEYSDSATALQLAKDETGLLALQTTIKEKTFEAFQKQGALKIPIEIREVYKTIGGSPFLDNSYTVFGEVIDGLDVVEKISLVKVDDRKRPLEDVRILKVEVFEQ